MKYALLCASIVAAMTANASTDNNFNLTIAHINDTHSNFDPLPSDFSNQSLLDGQTVFNTMGGHPRILNAYNEIEANAKQNNDSLLFLHGGDAWQGTGYFKLNEGKMNADILSKMNLDAMALGNHEFDLDNAKLADFINNVSFPVLGANMDTSNDADLNGLDNLHPYAVFAFDGHNKTRIEDVNNLPKDQQLVAVIGLVLEDMPTTSPNVGDVTFQSEIETAQALVNTLKEKGIPNIIALTHLGLARDIRIAENVNGIDVIVGGHSHSLLGDFANLSHGTNEAYAQLIRNPNGKQTCIIQAGQYAQAIGQATVAFTPEGDLAECNGGNTLLSSETFHDHAQRLDANLLGKKETKQVHRFIDEQPNIQIVAEDKTLRSHIDSTYKPALEQAYGDVIAHVPATLNHERRPGDNGTDVHGSRVAPIIAEGQAYWANLPEVIAATDMSVDFALVGAGGVRTNIEEGAYYEGNVSMELLPFSNYLSVVTLPGSTIKQLINETVTLSLDNSAHFGKFPYPGNMRFAFNEIESEKAGEITNIELRSGAEAWVTLQDDVDYNVVMTNYNANGNDDWHAIYEAQAEHAKRVDLVIENGVVTGYPVERVKFDGSRYTAIYKDGNAPQCDIETTLCNTDALSVIKYIRNNPQRLERQDSDAVTLNRLN
ncbi:bifunctional metallophosphatase/5'-nucleotidase [Thaumasiovibrio sp. DFM-14]|uniref:bifunctional metallophosphatase/5'-nucleotidase n=1 Tax=Thaumasiovibrio sp. DFM-14 TaxID=3384792 RepID=UPI00399FA593